jgi:hypothetical protein
MKAYFSDHHIRYVGKAWEIRNKLHALLKHAPTQDITLLDYLSAIEVNRKNNSMPVELQNKPLEKKRDPQIYVFPSL